MLIRLKSTVVYFLLLFWAAFLSSESATAVGTNEPIRIQVDASDTVHKIFSITEFIPLHGETSMTLLYPRREVLSHAPTTSVADLAGLELQLNGQSLEWHRDPLNVSAFQVSIPRNASALEAHFHYLWPVSGGIMSRNVVEVQWEHLMFYPQGAKVDDLPVVARPFDHGVSWVSWRWRWWN